METKLYVGNLSYSVTNEQVRDLFAPFGEVTSVNLIQGKGFGFVEMGTIEMAVQAKEGLNGKDFEGRNLKIDEARPQRTNRDSHGGSGGGGGFGGGREKTKRYNRF